MKNKSAIFLFCIISQVGYLSAGMMKGAVPQVKTPLVQSNQNITAPVQPSVKLNPVAKVISKTGAKLNVPSQGRLIPKAEQSQSPTMLQKGALYVKNALDVYVSQPLAKALGYSGQNNNLGVVDLVAGTSGMSYGAKPVEVSQVASAISSSAAPAQAAAVVKPKLSQVRPMQKPQPVKKEPVLQAEGGNMLDESNMQPQEAELKGAGLNITPQVGKQKSLHSFDYALEEGSLANLFEPASVQEVSQQKISQNVKTTNAQRKRNQKNNKTIKATKAAERQRQALEKLDEQQQTTLNKAQQKKSQEQDLSISEDFGFDDVYADNSELEYYDNGMRDSFDNIYSQVAQPSIVPLNVPMPKIESKVSSKPLVPQVQRSAVEEQGVNSALTQQQVHAASPMEYYTRGRANVASVNQKALEVLNSGQASADVRYTGSSYGKDRFLELKQPGKLISSTAVSPILPDALPQAENKAMQQSKAIEPLKQKVGRSSLQDQKVSEPTVLVDNPAAAEQAQEIISSVINGNSVSASLMQSLKAPINSQPNLAGAQGALGSTTQVDTGTPVKILPQRRSLLNVRPVDEQVARQKVELVRKNNKEKGNLVTESVVSDSIAGVNPMRTQKIVEQQPVVVVEKAAAVDAPVLQGNTQKMKALFEKGAGSAVAIQDQVRLAGIGGRFNVPVSRQAVQAFQSQQLKGILPKTLSAAVPNESTMVEVD